MDSTHNPIKVAGLALVLALPSDGAAQECASTLRSAVLGGGFVAATSIAVGLSADQWWSEPVEGFRMKWDQSPSREQDRLLHAMAGYGFSTIASELWTWPCLNQGQAAWAGAVTAFLASLPKEIGDGLRPDRGFSLPDFLATTAGAVLPVVHAYSPRFRAFQFKAFYWPSDEYRDRSGATPGFATDYAGQRYFLSFFPARLTTSPSGPDWLGVSIGHSTRTWITAPPTAQFFLTPEIDLGQLPPAANLPRFLSRFLSILHVPMPGVRLSDGDLSIGFY